MSMLSCCCLHLSQFAAYPDLINLSEEKVFVQRNGLWLIVFIDSEGTVGHIFKVVITHCLMEILIG